MTVYNDGKDAVVAVYGSGKKYGLEKMDQIVKNENVEQVRERVHQLLQSFYQYIDSSSSKYKNVNTLKEFLLYQNSLIYLHSVCN